MNSKCCYYACKDLIYFGQCRGTFKNTAYCSSSASQRWLKSAMFALQLYTMVDVQNLSPLCFMLGNKPSCFNDQLYMFYGRV